MADEVNDRQRDERAIEDRQKTGDVQFKVVGCQLGWLRGKTEGLLKTSREAGIGVCGKLNSHKEETYEKVSRQAGCHMTAAVACSIQTPESVTRLALSWYLEVEHRLLVASASTRHLPRLRENRAELKRGRSCSKTFQAKQMA
eukprot:1039704-Pleurochrysis_carterae.AAC.1